MRQARTARPAPVTARETAESPREESLRPRSESADPGDALARAERFGHRFADLSVQPIQRARGGSKGKGKGKKPQRQAPVRAEEEPAAPRDDRNWWQRNMPYVLGGTAPQEDRNWWRRSMPYALGGTAQHETRGYWGRVAPSFLGGQPVPRGPQVEEPQAHELEEAAEPEELARQPVAEEEVQVHPPVVEDEDGSGGEGPAPKPVRSSRKSRRKGKAPLIERLPDPEPDPVSDPEPDPVSEPESDPEPFVPDVGGKKSQGQKRKDRRARQRQAREAREAEIEEQRRLAQERELAATRRLPRRVVRHDRDFDSLTNRSGQGKAHRVGGDLHPAGNVAVTATEQLHQDSPNKGQSNRISFASLKAANANDYSRGGRNEAVHFKFRKWQRARIKGKADARGFEALSHGDVLRGIRGRGTREEQRTATAYANRDGEHQTIGRIPARFLHWQGQAPAYDSDSDDAETDDEA